MQEKQSQWLPSAVVLPSPNYDDRPAQMSIEAVIVHSISLPPGQYSRLAADQLGDHPVIEFFQNRLDHNQHEYYQALRELRVSSHFFINRAGRLSQCVPINKRAWHAGESYCLSRSGVNDFSIGIELEGLDTGSDGFTHAQYQTLGNLISQLVEICPHLNADAVFAHSDIAVGRKLDPGHQFNWARLYASLS